MAAVAAGRNRRADCSRPAACYQFFAPYRNRRHLFPGRSLAEGFIDELSQAACARGSGAVVSACGTAGPEEKTLYKKASPYATLVVTENERGLRTLWFGGYPSARAS